MRQKLLLLFVAAALVIASAKTYNVNLYSAANVGGTELKPGPYKVEVKDGKAVLANGKLRAEAPVKIETSESKFDATTVRFRDAGGKMEIQEIRLGGTNTKLVFN